jgi:hypothetical protein
MPYQLGEEGINNVMSNFLKNIDLGDLTELKSEIISLFPVEHYGKKCIIYVDNNIDVFLGIPKLKNLLEDLKLLDGITCLGFAFHLLPPHSTLGIHTDSDDFRYSLNIPLSEYDNNYMTFYETTHKPWNLSDNYASAKGFMYEQCSLVERVKVSTPYVIDTTVPHDSENKSDSWQFTFLIRLEPVVDRVVQQLTGLTDNFGGSRGS